MQDLRDEPGGSLWNPGEITLRVSGKGREADRIVRVRRPFALVGQAADSDICIADRAVAPRHAYLHLDPRGLFVVDLATQSGLRIDGREEGAGWLAPGQRIEVAGRTIEVLQLRLGDESPSPLPPDDDPLAEPGPEGLVSVRLEPAEEGNDPWSLGSELIFLGRSDACAIALEDLAVASVHCVIVRTPAAAFVVDLCGHWTKIDDRPVPGASSLEDGQSLTLGATCFRVRVTPPARRTAPATTLLARVLDPEVEAGGLIPADSHRALLSWMMETIRENQNAALRQQAEMQTALVQLIREVQHENATLLGAHLSRIERIDGELALIREELGRRAGEPSTPPAPAPAPSLAPPTVAPLRIPRKDSTPHGSKDSTTWLLERVSQLETENRSAWRDLLGRTPAAPRRPS